MEAYILIILPIFTTAALGWLGLYLIPRYRRLRENAETAKANAETAKLQAETTSAQTDALGDRLDLYDKQLRLTLGEIRALQAKVDALHRHLDEVYTSISYEAPEISQRIIGRLKTRRPNGEE